LERLADNHRFQQAESTLDPAMRLPEVDCVQGSLKQMGLRPVMKKAIVVANKGETQ